MHTCTSLELLSSAFCALGELEHALSTIFAASAGSARVGQSARALDELAFGSLAEIALSILPVMHTVRRL